MEIPKAAKDPQAPLLVSLCQSLVDELYLVSFEQLQALAIAPSYQAQISPDELAMLRSQLVAMGLTPQQMPGGAAYNSLCHYSLLGGKTLLLARYGDDTAGKLCKTHAESCGASVLAVTDPKLPTGTSIVLTAPDGSRCMLTCLGASGTFNEGEFAIPTVPPESWFFLEGYMLGIPGGVPLHFIKDLCLHGCKLAINIAAPWIPSRFPQEFEEALSLANLIFLNEHEAAVFQSSMSAQLSLVAHKLGSESRLAVVTNGKNGAFIEGMKNSLHCPARDVTVIDSTGAGDSFAAAFLRGLVLGAPIEHVAKGAAFLASEIIQHRGAFPPISLKIAWEKVVFPDFS